MKERSKECDRFHMTLVVLLLNRRALPWRYAPLNANDVSDELSLAEVPQIDQGVRKRFERVVQITHAFEA